MPRRLLSIAFFLSFLSCLEISAQEQTVINPERLEAAVHVEKMERSRQEGDTLIHNAAAYQVMQGADTESLISKMAGFSVSDSGVEAAGRTVAKVLLDGQEFFGNDVMTALRTVPADLVKQVEVIHKLSDNAQLSGVDDGEGYTVINVVTKRQKGNGTTAGRVYGNYGASDKTKVEGRSGNNYIVGGNISRFADKKTVNVIGMSNNISKFNFSTSDILSGTSGLGESAGKDFKVKPLSGISSVHSLGANYSDKKVNLSYFFSYVDNKNRPENEKFTMTSDPDRLQQTNTVTEQSTNSMTHRVTGKITFNPAKQHTLIFRPDLIFEKSEATSEQKTAYRYIYATKDPKFLRHQLYQSLSDKMLFRVTPSLNYRYSFKSKKRRSFSSQLKYQYYQNRGDYNTWQYKFKKLYTQYTPSEAYNTYIQQKDNHTGQHVATAQMTFTEPLTKRSLVSAQYYGSWSNTSTDNLVYIRDEQTQEFENSQRHSGVSKGIYFTNRISGRYNYAFKKFNVTFGAIYQHTMFRGAVTLPSVGHTFRQYSHFLYQLNASLPINKSNMLKIEAKSRTSNPSVSLMQDVVNMSSTSNVRAGNPALNPAYLHEAEVRYTYTDKKSGSTFSILANLTGSQNYFCDSLVIDSPDYEIMKDVKLGENNQFVKPINLSGYYKFYSKASYTIPIVLIRCNFNVNATVSMRQMPSMVNDLYVPVNNKWYQLGGRLDSNISKNIDFMLGYEARYTSNEYNGKYGLQQNNYIYQRIFGKMKWIFADDYTLSSAAQYRNMRSAENRYDDKVLLCDIFIGKKFLPSKSLEVSFGVNDLFNQNVKHYSHSVNATSITDSTSIGLGRYFSIQCIWNVRSAK